MPKSGTLTIDLKVSLMGQGLVTLFAAISLAVIFYLQLSLWIFLGALVVLAIFWVALIHRLNQFRWRRLVISHDGQVVLVARDKQREAGRIGRCFLTGFPAACFTVRTETANRWLCLFPDSTDDASWKRLKVELQRA